MADNYKVTKQEEVIDISGDGLGVRSMEVTFETVPSGVVSFIRVPIPQYTPDHVAELLDARATAIEAVHAL